MNRRRLVALVVLLAASATVPLLADDSSDAVEAVLKAYRVAYNERDAKAMGALYAKRALVLWWPGSSAGAAPLPREIIQAGWARRFEKPVALKTRVLTRDVSADIAYVVLSYHSREYEENGSIVLCLRRQPDGAWRITSDIWRQEPPPMGVLPLEQ